jgi:hypothetical protein
MDKCDSFEQDYKSSASTNGGVYLDHPSAKFSRKDSWLLAFCTYKYRHLLVFENMQVLIKYGPSSFNSDILFSNRDIRSIVSLYSLMAEV